MKLSSHTLVDRGIYYDILLQGIVVFQIVRFDDTSNRKGQIVSEDDLPPGLRSSLDQLKYAQTRRK